MKGEKRLIEIEDTLDSLMENLRLGFISKELYDREYKLLRKEMATILYRDAQKDYIAVEKEIKSMERELDSLTTDGLVIMARLGVKKSEKTVESIIRIFKAAIKRNKKNRTNYLRVMKDESKYL